MCMCSFEAVLYLQVLSPLLFRYYGYDKVVFEVLHEYFSQSPESDLRSASTGNRPLTCAVI